MRKESRHIGDLGPPAGHSLIQTLGMSLIPPPPPLPPPQLGLDRMLRVPWAAAQSFILSARAGMPATNPYHNWTHVVDVTQASCGPLPAPPRTAAPGADAPVPPPLGPPPVPHSPARRASHISPHVRNALPPPRPAPSPHTHTTATPFRLRVLRPHRQPPAPSARIP